MERVQLILQKRHLEMIKVVFVGDLGEILKFLQIKSLNLFRIVFFDYDKGSQPFYPCRFKV